jgi:hypothetical protein
MYVYRLGMVGKSWKKQKKNKKIEQGLMNDQDGIDELGTLGVVTLGPVITGTALAEHEVVRAKDLAERTSANWVNGTGLK